MGGLTIGYKDASKKKDEATSVAKKNEKKGKGVKKDADKKSSNTG